MATFSIPSHVAHERGLLPNSCPTVPTVPFVGQGGQDGQVLSERGKAIYVLSVSILLLLLTTLILKLPTLLTHNQ